MSCDRRKFPWGETHYQDKRQGPRPHSPKFWPTIFYTRDFRTYTLSGSLWLYTLRLRLPGGKSMSTICLAVLTQYQNVTNGQTDKIHRTDYRHFLLCNFSWGSAINPLMLSDYCHMGTAIKHPVPDRVKQSFVTSDIRAL